MKLNVRPKTTQSGFVKINESCSVSGFILNCHHCSEERYVILIQPQIVWKSQKHVGTAIILDHVTFVVSMQSILCVDYCSCIYCMVIKASLLHHSTSQWWAFIANALWLKQYVTFGTKQHYVRHFKTTVYLLIKLCSSRCLETWSTNQDEQCCNNFKADQRMDQK